MSFYDAFVGGIVSRDDSCKKWESFRARMKKHFGRYVGISRVRFGRKIFWRFVGRICLRYIRFISLHSGSVTGEFL